jgi:hypothetical protein
MKLAAFNLQLRFGPKPAKSGFSLAALPGGLRGLVPEHVLQSKDTGMGDMAFRWAETLP